MNTKIFLTSIALSAAFAAGAAPLTPAQALQRAKAGGRLNVPARISAVAEPVYISETPSGVSSAYVFNSPGGGYAILSADDVAFPVLGYSDTGSVDAENISPELKWWLGEYGRQIEWAIENNARQAVGAPSVPEEWTAIAPLMKTKWDQDAPYNNDCPQLNGVRCYTGCVATSMAQVMNYHKYPEAGDGMIRYRPDGFSKDLLLNLSAFKIDWDNMLDVYSAGEYNDAQASAVSYLMKACGYSVAMNYGTSASGAVGSVIAPALRNYFDYDVNCRDYQRVIYSSSEWTKMVYDNLKDVGPVVINGQSPSQGGHSFVCDGYDGKGYFHINWGWSGMSDGYYALDALNPDAQGIGGYAGGFNYQQNAIFGIQPPTGLPEAPNPDRLFQYGTTVATVSGNILTFSATDYDPLGWASGSDHSISVNIGAIIEPVEGTAGEVSYVQGALGSITQISLSGTSYYPAEKVSPNVVLPSLADGKYKVTLASKQIGDEEAQWLPVLVPWSYKNYVLLTVSGGAYSVQNVPVDHLTVSGLTVTSDFYAGKYVGLKALISNDSDIELSEAVTPMLLTPSGEQKFIGETNMISFSAKKSEEVAWVTKLMTEKGTPAYVAEETPLRLVLVNQQTGERYPGIDIDVTLLPAPSGKLTLSLTGSDIVGCERGPFESGGMNFNAYRVLDTSKFTYKFSYEVSKGYFDGEVKVGIYKQNPSNPKTMVVVVDEIYTDRPFLSAKEGKEVEIDVEFPDAEDNVVYFLYAQYTVNSSFSRLSQVAFIKGDGSGIDDVEMDADGVEEYYTLQGVKLANPVAGDIILVRKGNKVEKRVWK